MRLVFYINQEVLDCCICLVCGCKFRMKVIRWVFVFVFKYMNECTYVVNFLWLWKVLLN